MKRAREEIRAVFLDIDNTLLDFDGYVRECMREGFAKFGIADYDESMYSVFFRINTELWRGIETGKLTYPKLMEIRWKQIFEELELDFDGPTFEVYFREYLFSSAIPVPGAKDLLKYLRDTGKYRLYIASNGPHEQQLNRLRIAGMLSVFDDVFTSELVGYSKPGRAFFDEVFRRVNQGSQKTEDSVREILLPENSLMIGDSLTSDMEGAGAYGMQTCLYDPQEAVKHQDYPTIGWIVKDLHEIQTIL